MINIENLSFSYHRKHGLILDNINLDIKAGNIYGLLGPNGAGKSTLLYLIAGLLCPKSGDVKINGATTWQRNPSTLASYFLVPEEFQMPSISLTSYTKMFSSFYPNFSYEDLKRHLDTFDMEEKLNIGQLSMGQKKKVFMSIALACNTEVLMMDEPTNGLDIPGKSAFRKFIGSNMNEDKTIIISTHQVRDIDTLLDNIIMLNSNRILYSSPLSEIAGKLLFTTSNDSKEISQALYVNKQIGGSQIITENRTGSESRVDLETLFQFALSNPQKLSELLNR